MLNPISPSTFLKETYGQVWREDLLAIEGIEQMITDRDKARSEAGIGPEYDGMSIPDKIDAMKASQGTGPSPGRHQRISTDAFRKLRKDQRQEEADNS